MRSYTAIVNKHFKANKKKSFLAMFSIALVMVLLTIVLVLFKYNNECQIEFYKSGMGDYEVSYNLTGDKLDILKNNVLVKNYTIGTEEIKETLESTIGEQKIKLRLLEQKALNETFGKNLKTNLTSGSLPKSDNEIVLGENGKSGGFNIGSVINIGGRDYKVVGFYEAYDYDKREVSAKGLYTYKLGDSFTAYVKVKPTKDINKDLMELTKSLGYKVKEDNKTWANILSDEQQGKVVFNSGLIEEAYGVSFYGSSYFYSFRFIRDIVTGFIMLIAITATYGCVNFMMGNKTKEFGILRCIGASSKQIRSLVYKESMLIWIFSIAPAIIIGYLISFVVSIYLGKTFPSDFNITLGIYPKIILEVIGLSFITILIGALKPALRAGRISPIEGIKSKGKTTEGVKARKSLFIRKVFGIEGELAYRNLRAKSTMFWIGTIILSLSFMIVIIFTTYISSIVEGAEARAEVEKDFTFNTYIMPEKIAKMEQTDGEVGGIDDEEYKKLWKDSYFDSLKIRDEIKKYLKSKTSGGVAWYSSIPIEKSIVIEGSKGIRKGCADEFEINTEPEKGVVLSKLGQVLIYNNEAFNMIKDKIKGKNPSLDKFKDNGIIFIETLNEKKATAEVILDFDEGAPLDVTFGSRWPKEINGDPVKARKEITEYIKKNNKTYKMNPIGTISPADLLEIVVSANTINYIISEDFFNKNKEELLNNFESPSEFRQYYGFNLENKNKENIKEINTNLETLVKGNNSFLHDNVEEAKASRRIANLFNIIGYGFLGFVISIVMVSIVVNKTMTIDSRKKEFGTLLALGMERKYMKKSMILEAIIQWLIVLVVSIPVSFLGAKLILKNLFSFGEVASSDVSISLFIVTSILALVIIFITNFVPFRKFKGLDTVEMMKEED